MDLNYVKAYLRPSHFEQVLDQVSECDHYTWLAGGTWLFSEPQPTIDTLIDITGLGWSELDITPEGLTIGATCIMSQLLHSTYPAHWTGIRALQAAVQELASFKVQHVATVGGNLCLAIPAGTFAPAMILLGATYEIVSRQTAYSVPATAFQTGIKQTILQPGELLRRIWIPETYLQWQVSYQRLCVATAGLALSIVAAAYHPQTQHVRFAIGAALAAPRLLELDHVPSDDELAPALAHLPDEFLDDALASAAYRRQMTQVLMRRSLQAAMQSDLSV